MLAALCAATVTSALWLVPAEAHAPAQRYADRAFAATNHQRTERDLRALRERRCLTGFAERWARHLAREGELVHQPLGPIMRRCDLRSAGENIAYGYASGRAVVIRGWMHSEGHRENILRPRFRLMGIGAHRDDRGTWWVSQVFGRG
ncbi:CAP domain-containing protein [Nocardioides sp. YIM 152315]|nr:CAP domain-containing protein [Nocardioides sp. YIM 152315]